MEKCNLNLCPYAIIYEIGHYTSLRATVPHTISYVLNPLHACWALEMENARVRMIRVNKGSKEYKMASNNSNLQFAKDDELIYKKYL
jgi:hypothetical protein